MPRKASPSRVKNKKNEILSEAWEIFRKNGFRKTTIVEIGNEIGQSQANIYYYFKNGKDEIYVECLLKELDKLKDKYIEISSNTSPIEDKVIELLSLRLKFFYKNIIDDQLLDLNLKKVPHDLKKQLFDFIELEAKTIQSVLEKAKQKGEMDPPNIHQTTEILIHISKGIRYGNKFKYLLTQQKPVINEMLTELERSIRTLFKKWKKSTS